MPGSDSAVPIIDSSAVEQHDVREQHEVRDQAEQLVVDGHEDEQRGHADDQRVDALLDVLLRRAAGRWRAR